MTEAADIAIHQASRRHFADVVGLSRGTNLQLRAMSAVSMAAAIVAGYLAWSEARHSADRVERYVIELGPDSTVVSKIGIGTGWTPVAGTYVDFAQRWVLYLRGRPLDRGTLKYQRGEVIRATERPLYGQLGAWMKYADDAVGTGGVKVDEISALPLKIENDKAIISVRWHEQVMRPGEKPADWTATLTIAYVEPKLRGEFGRNPLGLYVQGFDAAMIKRS